MIALVAAFAVLFACFYWLLSRGGKNGKAASAKALNVENGGQRKLTRAEKLQAEAFEFCSLPGQTADESSGRKLPVLVMYATEYGFSKEVARRAASLMSDTRKLRPRVVNVADYSCINFAREHALLLVCSTTGDGVPPNEARDFRDALQQAEVAMPTTLKYAVLAMGDKGYPHFCRGGIIFDELLRESTSTPSCVPRGDVDQEDWDVITPWVESFIEYVLQNVDAYGTANDTIQASNVHDQLKGDPPTSNGHAPLPDVIGTNSGHDEYDYLVSAMAKYAESLEDSAGAVRYTRNEPYFARLTSRSDLTCASKGGLAPGELPKHVIRVELDIEGAGIKYSAGDALGVVPRNNPDAVERLLRTIACSGDELVSPSSFVGSGPESPTPGILSAATAPPVKLKAALEESVDLRVVRAELLHALLKATTDATEKTRLEELLGVPSGEPSHTPPSPSGDAAWKKYAEERDVVDVLSDFPSATLSPAELVNLMRPLTARYYSISSSPVVSPDRVALTVDVLRYMTLSTPREGVASTFLNDRVAIGQDPVGVFISRNDNFRLPQDSSRPIVMIGPGTGIAPFIAFLDERTNANATGRNILYFGCRHERSDFLYADRLQDLERRGELELHTAFSRDQAEKIYVQHRLRENSSETWKLLDEDNAHVYICGDGARMALDVDAELRRIVRIEGGMTTEQASTYLEQLAERGRLQRDVWVT